MDGKYYNLWSTDNDKTDANDDVVIKTVYDPSPIGYSLPASNAFTGFTTTGEHTGNPNFYNVKGSFDKGWYFYTKPNKKGDTVFFPAWGYRYFDTGLLHVVSSYGFYWVADPYDKNDGRDLHFGPGGIGPLFSAHHSFGFSLRSAEEKCGGKLMWFVGSCK